MVTQRAWLSWSVFRTQSNILDGVFEKVVNAFHSFTSYPKSSILDVWQGSENVYTFYGGDLILGHIINTIKLINWIPPTGIKFVVTGYKNWHENLFCLCGLKFYKFKLKGRCKLGIKTWFRHFITKGSICSHLCSICP